MVDEPDSVPIGRFKSDATRVTFRTKCTDESDFVRRFRGHISHLGIVLKQTDQLQPGAELELDIRSADGRTIFLVTGTVGTDEGIKPGEVRFRFTLVPEEYRPLLEQLEKAAAEPPPECDAPAPQERVHIEASALRGHLEDSLRRMVLIDEEVHDDSAPVARGPAREGPIIGIDLGTTNSCCAMVKGEKPFVIPSRRGHNTIPSVVSYTTTGEVLVGHAALAQMEIHPERTVYGSKRLVGRPFDSPIVRQVRDRFHYKIVEGPKREAAVLIDDRVFGLEEISAHILEDIRNTAQDFLGRAVERAVITVPAYYNDNQRSAVRKAGELAGFAVERIVNEPTAAALAYGYNRSKERRLLVYDLGGGTFDATVLELKGDLYQVLSTGGDTFLGGLDFDTQLMDYILIEFQLSLGRIPEMERVAYLRVLQAAEFAKRALSAKSEATVRLPFIGRLEGKPVDLEVRVTREQLEQMVGPLVRRTMDVCDAVLAQRSMKPENIDDILLVGGQTRMPMVHRLIQEHFGREPLKGVHPDESVAVGAALLAHSLSQHDKLRLVDVLPISIGLGVPGGVFRRVITAGTTLPTSRTYGLYTYLDNQVEMHLPVYQGESGQVDENEYLGTVVLQGIPSGVAGSRMIEVTFRLNQESLLSVSARDRDGAQLANVVLSTQDTSETLRAKLGAFSPESRLSTDVLPPEPTCSQPEKASAPTRAAQRPIRRRGWLSRLWGWLWRT